MRLSRNYIFVSVIVILGLIVRFLPFMSYPNTQAGYRILKSIRILNLNNKTSTTDFTPFSAAIFSADNSEFFIDTLQTYILQVTGLFSFEGQDFYLRFFPLEGTLFITLSVLSIYSLLRRYHKSPIKTVHIVLLTAASCFSSPMSITLSHLGLTNTPLGWFFIILVIYSSLQIYLHQKEKRNYLKWLVLRLIFISILIVSYHTVSLVFFVLIIVDAIVHLVYGTQGRKILFATLYSVGFIAYLSILSRSFFTSYIKLAQKLNPLIQTSRNEVLSNSIVLSTGILNTVINSLAIICVAIPAFALFYVTLRFNNSWLSNLSKELSFFGFMVALFPLSIAFYGFMGLPGLINRIGEYGTIMTLIAISLIMGVPKTHIKPRGLRFLVYLCAMGIVPLSGFSFLIGDVKGNVFSTQEVLGAKTISEHIRSDILVFSDFRLAGAFFSQGHFLVNGVTDYSSSNELEEQIDSIFYSINEQVLKSSLREYFSDYNYIFLSQEMTKDTPGIKLFDHSIKGMTLEQYDKFSSLASVYSNGSVDLFAVY